MCEANVYITRDGKEELLMEKVDRIVPGNDNNIFLENIFGERCVIQARICEMELIHHRVILEEMGMSEVKRPSELWMDLGTEHGHFHEGEEVRLKLFKGYNMHPDSEAVFTNIHAYANLGGYIEELELHHHQGYLESILDQKSDGIVQVYAREQGETELYATVLVEVGHHHHQEIKPAGLPLEIVPTDYSHAHLGDHYEVKVLQEGQPLAGAEVRVTYSSTKNPEYPHHLITDEEGRAHIYLTARGNYLFAVTSEKTISTFTLIKSI